MRLSNFLVGMLACAAITACSNDDNGNATNNGTESDGNTYLAVNLVANNDAMTRAFENGTPSESGVSSARFYFFNNSGQPCSVTATGQNYIDVAGTAFTNWTQNPETNSNIEYQSNAVLVINNQNTAPTSTVVILNPPISVLGSDNRTLTSLRNFAANYASYTNDNNFVMSNSVYVNGNNVIETATNIQDYLESDNDAAMRNPVHIYVERVVAKVRVTYGSQNNFNTGATFNSNPVYAKVLGWTLAYTKPDSYTLKNLADTWIGSAPFTKWNDAQNHRSYWAQGTTTAVTNTNAWNSITNNNALYCNENAGDNNTTPTELLVAAQLVSDETGNTPVEIAKIMGQQMTVEGLKNWILNALQQQHPIYYLSSSPDTYETIQPEHISFRRGTSSETEIESYEVVACVADDAPQLYVRTSTNPDNFATIDDATVNGYLDDYIAQIWENGQTYYHVAIDHLGNMEAIVRNHLYDITISGITGLGTPVYDPTQIIIPEDVEDRNSYLAARINILAWNVVSNDVTLGQ